MKKLFVILLTLAVLMSAAVPVFATEQTEASYKLVYSLTYEDVEGLTEEDYAAITHTVKYLDKDYVVADYDPVSKSYQMTGYTEDADAATKLMTDGIHQPYGFVLCGLPSGSISITTNNNPQGTLMKYTDVVLTTTGSIVLDRREIPTKFEDGSYVLDIAVTGYPSFDPPRLYYWNPWTVVLTTAFFLSHTALVVLITYGIMHRRFEKKLAKESANAKGAESSDLLQNEIVTD